METFHVQPLAVKEHERRWYLVAYCHERSESQTGNKGMNNGESMASTGRVPSGDRDPFRMPDGFDVEGLFCQSYGIFFPKEGERPVTIRFKVTEEEARYIHSPIHRSQTEEGEAEGGGRLFRIKSSLTGTLR